MRATLTLDDDLGMALKKAAHHKGTSFKAEVNAALRSGLQRLEEPPEPRRYRLTPRSMGAPAPGVDLSKALQLADALEDEGIAGKLELRK